MKSVHNIYIIIIATKVSNTDCEKNDIIIVSTRHNYSDKHSLYKATCILYAQKLLHEKYSTCNYNFIHIYCCYFVHICTLKFKVSTKKVPGLIIIIGPHYFHGRVGMRCGA